jgi:hypothetical protein
MTHELKQDIGPPIATPERLTRAKQIVGLGDRQVLVAADCQKRKRVWPPFHYRFVGSLAVEFELWLTSVLADQSPRKHLGADPTCVTNQGVAGGDSFSDSVQFAASF